MKKTITLLLSLNLILGVFGQNINDANEKDKKLKFGIGIGFGYVDAGEVNDFVNRYYDNTDFYIGFPDVIISYNGNVTLQYFVSNNFEVCAELVGSWAPKFISGGNPNFFYLTKFSPGLTANYHFISKNNSNKSFFVGAGINYNLLAFKFGDQFKVRGNTPGALMQIGWMRRMRTKSIKYGLTFNYVETDNLEYSGGSIISELSYSGINLGAIFYF